MPCLLFWEKSLQSTKEKNQRFTLRILLDVAALSQQLWLHCAKQKAKKRFSRSSYRMSSSLPIDHCVDDKAVSGTAANITANAGS